MENNFLTPKNNLLRFSPGPGEVLIKGVISHNEMEFKLPINLSLKIERDLNGGTETIEIPINSFISINDRDLSAVEFPLKRRAYDSFMKLSIVNNSKQEVDYKIEVPNTWTSQ